MRKLFLLLLLTSQFASGQTQDSVFIRKIFDVALDRGHAYEDLRSLCKDIGARLSGSAEAEMAVYWGEQKMKAYGIDRVYLQEIEVPHWERGTKEAAWIKNKKGEIRKVEVLALGGSVGTDGLLSGDIVQFETLEDLKGAHDKQVEGKIVFLSQAMDNKEITTFSAYGGCWPNRGLGAVEAAKKGALAVVIRSLGFPVDEHPHTGSLIYNDTVKRIPGAALSTRDAELLADWLKKGKVELLLEMHCHDLGTVVSYNVVGEIKGSSERDKIITVGGHLDSWDVGEGAHDDGAGIMHSPEAFRILKELDYRPRHTLRVVFFMNEENGDMGGRSYARFASEANEKHVAAIESDAGGFSPRGFDISNGTPEFITKVQEAVTRVLKPYELYRFEDGYGGTDIDPLKNFYPEIVLFGLVPDSQRYFDFHHTAADVFENVNKRELEMGCASTAAFLYLIDQKLF
ncbi:MAG: M20/M25/M40 family metallo-hydrolase [Bacteroidales bacterium]